MHKTQNTIIKNQIVIFENNNMTCCDLDKKYVWEVGRVSPGFTPDICFESECVNFRHGKFQRRDEYWFYIDYYGEKITKCNGKQLFPGIRGRKKPILLKDGDKLTFGENELCITIEFQHK